MNKYVADTANTQRHHPGPECDVEMPRAREDGSQNCRSPAPHVIDGIRMCEQHAALRRDRQQQAAAIRTTSGLADVTIDDLRANCEKLSSAMRVETDTDPKSWAHEILRKAEAGRLFPISVMQNARAVAGVDAYVADSAAAKPDVAPEDRSIYEYEDDDWWIQP